MLITPIKLKDCLLSEAIGDICGSPWEFAPYKQLSMEGLKASMTFDYSANQLFEATPLFENYNNQDAYQRIPHRPIATDDTICTFAIAEAVLNGTDIQQNLEKRCLQHINVGYGPMFVRWLMNPNKKPYNSYGNGSAMRCSIAGWFCDNHADVVSLATKTAEPTHNHPDGIKGAVQTALAIYRGRKGWNKEDISEAILEQYPEGWKDVTWDMIHEQYTFDVTCNGSVPVVAIILRESSSFEDCILRCIQSGGDADTLCAIAGPIAYSVYREFPDWMYSLADKYLPDWCKEVNEQFNQMNGF